MFEERGENGQCNLVYVDGELLDDGVNGSYVVDDSLKHVLSVVLVLWAVGPVLRNGYGN